MTMYQIGEVSEALGLSPDTLRYYEKSGLLPPVARNVSGLRNYSDKDISRLKFIRRAQRMNFSLAEIAQLLKMRENPRKARPKVRELTRLKLTDIETSLVELESLRDELRQLLNLCSGSTDGCAIIEGIDQTKIPN